MLVPQETPHENRPDSGCLREARLRAGRAARTAVTHPPHSRCLPCASAL